jgi:hypothetical protein
MDSLRPFGSMLPLAGVQLTHSLFVHEIVMLTSCHATHSGAGNYYWFCELFSRRLFWTIARLYRLLAKLDR